MMRRLAALVLAAAVGSAAGAHGQGTPNGTVRDRSDYAPIVLNVACGDLRGPPCAVALPKIAVRAAQSGLDLKPMESGAALGTFAAVCEARAAAAIVQRDAVAYLANNPACTGHYAIVGRAIFPYYAVLIVRADAPFRSIGDMAADGPDGRKKMIGAATGGQVTLSFLLKTNPDLERTIGVVNDDPISALDRIASGAIDGFFAIETLNGDLLDRVRVKLDPAGKPLYRFVDVRPGPEFLRTGDGLGQCLYRLTAMDFGGRNPVTTISVDAVMVLGQSFRDAHAKSGPRAGDALTSAIAATQNSVLADMKSPRDWRPVIASCKG
jgi:hypothetical protein